MISEALKVDPNSAQAHFDQGLVLQALNRSDEALASYTRAIDLNPYFAEAFFNRGNVLRRLGRHEQELDSYTNAIRIRGDYIKALNGQGNALRDLRRSEEALASYRQALAIEPDDVAALTNYGNALRDLNRSGEAFVIYDRALAASPDDKIVLFNRAIGLMTIRHYERAIVDFERPPGIGAAEGHVQGHLLHCTMHCGDWRSYRTDWLLIIENVRAKQHCIDPFELLTVCGSEADHLLCSQLCVKKECPPSTSPIWRGERYRHERIRVAYLSGDFHDHPTAFLAAGLFEHHDRARFETIAVSFGPDQQLGVRARIRDAVNHFCDVRQKSGRDVAELLRDLEVDNGVDLRGFTERGRPKILAFRPAPIQVGYLGYPGTMGADYMDCIIADRIVIPKSHREYCTEKVVYLPDSYKVNDSKRQIAEGTPSRAEVGLPHAGFVFCSFNNSYKITPTAFDIWMRLLRGVEGSALWLLESNGGVARHLQREAADRGVTPERLAFAPFISSEDHLARCRLADLCLDTLPCNAHTTASDALWAGVPMVTCLGSSFAGRVGASVLNAAGLSKLISRSLEDYEQLALRLATYDNALFARKDRLRMHRKTCALFDTDRFRRHIEAAYMTMWERYQDGKMPESFAV